jgi:acetolactate synthase-1/3 small subunit
MAGNTGTPRTPGVTHHILTVLVENKAGVLSRVAGLFSRRGFNIFSLAVSPTDDERFSRMTIVVDAESAPIEQILRQTEKLINVVDIRELVPGEAVERELILTTVRVGAEFRGQVTELASIFEAKILDVGPDALTLMAAGTPDKIDAMEELLRPFGITELQRTGRIALPRIRRPGARGAPDMTGRTLAAVPESS